MKKSDIEFMDHRNKVSVFLSKLFLICRGFVLQEKFNFMLGLSQKRFAFACFWINGKKDMRVAKDYGELQKLAGHFCKQYHLVPVSDFMLLKMWASRKLILFQSQSVRIEIVTYWHF